MVSSQSAREKKPLSLNADDKKTLESYLEMLNAGDARPEEKKALIQKLQKKTPLRLLYLLSENNADLNVLLETNEELNKCWSSFLERLQYPCQEITSFDEQRKLSCFTQLKGAFLMSEYCENPDPSNPTSKSILDQACKIGMFRALIIRIQFNIDNITGKNSPKPNTQKTEEYMDVILNDIKNLGNLYWATGSLNSAFFLLDLASYLNSQPAYKLVVDKFFLPAVINRFSWQKNYQSENIPYPLILLQASIESFYMARQLSLPEFTDSKLIELQITHGKGMFSPYSDNFSTDKELQELILKKLITLNVVLVESFCRNAEMKVTDTVKQHLSRVKNPC